MFHKAHPLAFIHPLESHPSMASDPDIDLGIQMVRGFIRENWYADFLTYNAVEVRTSTTPQRMAVIEMQKCGNDL